MKPINSDYQNEEAIDLLESLLKKHEHNSPEFSPMHDYIEYVIDAIMKYEARAVKW